MRRPSLQDADSVHSCGGDWKASWHPIWHPEFRRFSLYVRDLERSLGEAREEPVWQDSLRALKRYRFELSTAPLPFSYQGDAGERLVSSVTHGLTNCERLYPEAAQNFQLVLDSLNKLITSSENPLLGFLEGLLSREDLSSAAVLVAESRLIPATEQILKSSQSLSALETVAPPQLRKDRSFRNLAVIGAATWYPDHILGAPRAHRIQIVHYGWIRDSWKPSSLFLGSEEGGTELRWNTHIIEAKPREANSIRPDAEVVRAKEMVPEINWDQLSRNHAPRVGGALPGEAVRARTYLLEGGFGVFLDTDESSTVLAIDLEEEPEERVKKLPTANLSVGQFILLRTEGGGDYIPEIADHLLGGRAKELRTMQIEWKKLLVKKVIDRTPSTAVADLTVRGSSRAANVANLFRWISYRSICTQDPEDFRAILDYVGLGRQFDKYWNAMKSIQSAHQLAGHHIRNLLLGAIREADLTPLLKLGLQQFELSQAGAGSMTAFRLIGISPETIEVPVRILQQQFKV